MVKLGIVITAFGIGALRISSTTNPEIVLDVSAYAGSRKIFVDPMEKANAGVDVKIKIPRINTVGITRIINCPPCPTFYVIKLLKDDQKVGLINYFYN